MAEKGQSETKSQTTDSILDCTPELTLDGMQCLHERMRTLQRGIDFGKIKIGAVVSLLYTYISR